MNTEHGAATWNESYPELWLVRCKRLAANAINNAAAILWERSLMQSIKCKWREAAAPCKADMRSCEPGANLWLKKAGVGAGWMETCAARWECVQPCLNVESGAGAAENEEDTWSGFGASLRRPEGRSYLQPMWSSTLLQACSAELGGGQHKDWRIGSAGTLSGSTPKQGALDNSGHDHQLQIEHKGHQTVGWSNFSIKDIKRSK